MSEGKYWRIRMKYGGYEELAPEAWDRGEVGIWYGAWNGRELEAALKSGDALDYLSRINRKRGLAWDMSATFLHLATRFRSIDRKDWVLIYFDGKLRLARVSGEIMSSRTHPFNRKGELFKYRKIVGKKSFSLDRLPDAFRLLAAAGRGNVFQPRGAGELVKLLGEAPDEAGVVERLESKSLDELLDLLGPTSWESVCEAYLCLAHGFVPTGLKIGGTLRDFDIVGRRSADGARILAQCKKDPQPVPIQGEFLDAIGKRSRTTIAFYFAYGGCSGDVPAHVKVIDRNVIVAWSKTHAGARYFKWLRGG
jgi:hypothetical protein